MRQEYPQSLAADRKQYSRDWNRAERLLETTCEFDIGPGQTVQWYAVRLSK
ncbi:MAG: chlororespiratory reduction protein 7 [Cyanobacteria bacterium P01_E01_bin.48]